MAFAQHGTGPKNDSMSLQSWFHVLLPSPNRIFCFLPTCQRLPNQLSICHSVHPFRLHPLSNLMNTWWLLCFRGICSPLVPAIKAFSFSAFVFLRCQKTQHLVHGENWPCHVLTDLALQDEEQEHRSRQRRPSRPCTLVSRQGPRCSSSAHVTSDQALVLSGDNMELAFESQVSMFSPPPLLTCALREVPQIEDVVEFLVVVLFNVGGLFWCVLQLHSDFFQVLIQLEDKAVA